MPTGSVNSTSVNLRDMPDGKVVAILPLGTQVDVKLDDGSGWMLVIAVADGRTQVGYLDARFVDSAGPTSPVPGGGPAGATPAAKFWLYVQKTGKMFHIIDGAAQLLAIGYSGNGDAENDPDQQCAVKHGPLPRGEYTIGPPMPFNGMQNCLFLTPDPQNDMCGRSGFLIHDGRFNGRPHDNTSEGCICLQPQWRLTIWRSDDHRLVVSRDDPPAPT